MPTPIKLKAPFFPDSFYHIVCKSIDDVLLFREHEDYVVFNNRFRQFTYPFLLPWSYNLLKNHSHHVVKTNSESEIVTFINNLAAKKHSKAMGEYLLNTKSDEVFDRLIERLMNSFLVSYVNYYNNKYGRRGGLFQKPFKRIQIDDATHLQQAIIYVNANAQKHKIVTDFKIYPYCSYKDVFNLNNSHIDVNGVIAFFGGKKAFIDIHQKQVDYFYSNSWPNSKLE